LGLVGVEQVQGVLMLVESLFLLLVLEFVARLLLGHLKVV
jgi:hypothetical protein